MIWHVVSNAEGTILGVYGSALLADAQAKAAEIKRGMGCATFLHHVRCAQSNRPSVGGSISMKNVRGIGG